MRTILTMVARPEKFQLRSNELLRKDNSRFAIRMTPYLDLDGICTLPVKVT